MPEQPQVVAWQVRDDNGPLEVLADQESARRWSLGYYVTPLGVVGRPY